MEIVTSGKGFVKHFGLVATMHEALPHEAVER
jgi:hypothetical protein